MTDGQSHPDTVKAFDPNFGKTGFAARLMNLRFRRLRLNQSQFADRFGLTLGAVKDLEQARTKPTRAMVLLAAAIERDPVMMAEIALGERDALSERQPAGHRWERKGDRDGSQRIARNFAAPSRARDEASAGEPFTVK